jgi:transposase-like protein
MTGTSSKIEVLDGLQRRRHWTTSEKLSFVQETFEPDATVSLVARRRGVAPNQLFRWRKLATQGALTATSAQEEVVARIHDDGGGRTAATHIRNHAVIYRCEWSKIAAQLIGGTYAREFSSSTGVT